MLNPSAKKAVSFLVGLVLLVSSSLVIPSLRPAALTVLRLPLKVFSFVGGEVKALVFFHRNAVDAQRLRQRNDLLTAQLHRLEDISRENVRLRSLLDLPQHAGYKVIPAAVIGRDPSNWSSAVIIDKGQLRGVRKGCVVVNFLGLVGRVVEAGPRAAKVALVNDPALSVSCRLQRTRIEGLVSGSLGGYLVMKFLPKDADVAVGDSVVTAGLSAVYPKGILVGTVTSVAHEFSGVSMYALIKPAVELSALEEVLVIIP